jgi:hypothetical protein
VLLSHSHIIVGYPLDDWLHCFWQGCKLECQHLALKVVLSIAGISEATIVIKDFMLSPGCDRRET